MELFLYAIIFITGIFFGSFFTLAVYRIPKKEDILIKHSYCPNCNTRLGFFDLFPVLSYICLGGKCRYCKNKIRPRYLILELLSGVTFLILAIAVKINFFDVNSIINTIFLLLYVSILFIIAGIDKENINIEKNVLILGFGIEIIYIIYQYTLKQFNVYQYVIYFIIVQVLILIINKKINKDKKYIIQNLYLFLYMAFGMETKICIFTLVLTVAMILISKLKSKKQDIRVPIGYYLSISNILVIIILNTINNYVI